MKYKLRFDGKDDWAITRTYKNFWGKEVVEWLSFSTVQSHGAVTWMNKDDLYWISKCWRKDMKEVEAILQRLES